MFKMWQNNFHKAIKIDRSQKFYENHAKETSKKKIIQQETYEKFENLRLVR